MVVVVGRKLCDGIRAGTNFTAATHLLLEHAKETLVYKRERKIGSTVALFPEYSLNGVSSFSSSVICLMWRLTSAKMNYRNTD